MKIIEAVLLFTLGLSFTIAQECTEISRDEIESVFLNAVRERLAEGSPILFALDEIHEFNFNCMAPGCMRNTYRSLTITADIEYTTTSSMREVRQLDVPCIYENGQNGQAVWPPGPFTGSSVIQTPEQIDLLLRGETNESCASCDVLQVPTDPFHCVACAEECLNREPGLMRCTGIGPEDCYSFFDREGMCVQDCGTNQSPDEDNQQCVCINFYDGPDCEECLLDAWCRNSAVPDDECLYCNCTECYFGVLCEDHPCDPNPCENDGTCVCTDTESRQTVCVCPPRYTGEFCEIELDSCVSNPCRNGGTCEDIMGEAVCSCPEGYTGQYCDIVDNCNPNPCNNGGTCINTGVSFTCICPVEYTGPLCDEIGQNPCCPSPCYNQQTCILTDDENGYRCECQDGFVGELCEESVCGMSSCQHGGVCVRPMLIGHPYCLCPSTRKGDQCQKCASTHIKLVTGDCILDCDASCDEYEDDSFQYDLCRYHCHAESWIDKLTQCGYTPPPISEMGLSQDRKMEWERVKSESERALDWVNGMDPTCYPIPEPPYIPPPPTVSSGPTRSGTDSRGPGPGMSNPGSSTPMMEPSTGMTKPGPGTPGRSRSSRSSSRSTSRSRPGPRPGTGSGSARVPPSQETALEPAINDCVDEYLLYLRDVIEYNPSWFEYTMKSDAMLSEEDAMAMLNDLDSDSYQEDISEVYRPLLQYWAAQFSTYCEHHEGQCSS